MYIEWGVFLFYFQDVWIYFSIANTKLHGSMVKKE